MSPTFAKTGSLALCAFLAMAAQASAQTDKKHDHGHEHSHDHDRSHDAKDIQAGLFDDDQIRARDLSDWAGDWQSVYPLLQDGTLDAVMRHKAEHGDKTAEEYRAYYQTGYQTDMDRILIEADRVTFFADGIALQGRYADDGHEVLTYASGNRGVRYVFAKTEGDAQAPAFIQFSDHAIAPNDADHYHLYWGEDRAALLQEVANWPTYYPSALTGEEIAAEMTAH
ncbi:metal-binding protein ZinT [Paracoccus sp. 1_MG-2023]|uniref:ZinT family metal-binding protein n=1 Tax=unclassified Paracoccus (in: a-proteobacteria) TaxID=2688777 RepID=UPI001C0A297D|nr:MULTISPECIES: metal-binding protein ZinT [unclassified Paracoccus (in: a-proteobacteria)]MBU2958008.1 metal-binding protein ZinT [Paracoccus sp. C2R09]MDO6668798.1 metal-binding protein ZinT [Paracoccus sp. 1_MG-2023]